MQGSSPGFLAPLEIPATVLASVPVTLKSTLPHSYPSPSGQSCIPTKKAHGQLPFGTPKSNLASLSQKLVPRKHAYSCPHPRLPIIPYSQPPGGFFLYYFIKAIISTHTAAKTPHALISFEPTEEAANWMVCLSTRPTILDRTARLHINHRHPLHGSSLLTG